jgi:L-aminopeptidase/D-esterase-like protein
VRGEGSVVEPGQLTTPPWAGADPALLENTTIGVVATNANLDKGQCLLVAQSAHDGMARALEPVHTAVDGDAVVAAAVGGVAAPLERVRLLAARVSEAAIRGAGGR